MGFSMVNDVELVNMEGIGTVAVVKALPVCATYFGEDKYFEYWLGVDGVLYGL